MGCLWLAMKFSSKNLGLDGRDFMLSFHTVRDRCGLGFEPEIDVSGFGLLVHGNRFLFVEGP